MIQDTQKIAEKYKNQKDKLKLLNELSSQGLTIVQKKDYYKDRLKNLELQYKRWKEQYPEFFI